MILVDANIWTYFFDANAKEHARVKSSLPRLLGDEELLMPTVVQMEVVHYLVKRLGSKAREAVDTFLAQAAAVEPLTGGITAEAARLLLEHHATGLGGRDAALLVMARRHEALLLTNDKDLAKVAKAIGVKVANTAA